MKVKMLSIDEIRETVSGAARGLVGRKKVRHGKKKRKGHEVSRRRGESYSHREMRASGREYRIKNP